MYGGGVAPDLPLEILQQYLSFASSMGLGIVMQGDDTIIQHVKEFASDGFTTKLKGKYLGQGSLQTVMWKQLRELAQWARTRFLPRWVKYVGPVFR
ncbi:hypothetical protein AVEN_103005-1 [Araneus ventricosus]|uniref:Uncharacterized protein n=1 Tax=Araneus ventricosus TaxID=182803 RepID=A0A4Y2BA90_ARAVE|nr:hypothetical protein AVEN_103005-1 [Araneus ventricosus]